MIKKFAILEERLLQNPAAAALVEEYVRAMDDVLRLIDLRKQRGLTQAQLAALMDVSQANISRVEHQDDLYLSTLRGYVEALRGELEVTARFPDGETIKVA